MQGNQELQPCARVQSRAGEMAQGYVGGFEVSLGYMIPPQIKVNSGNIPHQEKNSISGCGCSLDRTSVSPLLAKADVAGWASVPVFSPCPYEYP